MADRSAWQGASGPDSRFLRIFSLPRINHLSCPEIWRTLRLFYSLDGQSRRRARLPSFGPGAALGSFGIRLRCRYAFVAWLVPVRLGFVWYFSENTPAACSISVLRTGKHLCFVSPAAKLGSFLLFVSRRWMRESLESGHRPGNFFCSRSSVTCRGQAGDRSAYTAYPLNEVRVSRPQKRRIRPRMRLVIFSMSSSCFSRPSESTYSSLFSRSR
jgi:hypothetical protein